MKSYHAVNCSALLHPVDRRAYDLGWDDGRQGREIFPGNSLSAYVNGCFDGEAAREEAENGDRA